MRPRLLIFAAALTACGAPTAQRGDRHFGVIDPTVLDAKLQPSTDKTACGSTACYPAQLGYAQGEKLYFRNFGAIPAKSLGKDTLGNFAIPTSALSSVVELTSCDATATDARRDAFPRDRQLPVHSALPLAPASATTLVFPAVAVHAYDGAGSRCNDAKTMDSMRRIGFTTDGTPSRYAMRPVVDLAAVVKTAEPGAAQPFQLGWYKGLLLAYFDGGSVPAANDFLIGMDGALVSAAGGTSAKTTDSGAVILSARPGEERYSPVVNLREITLPAGKKAGDFTSICTASPCDPAALDISAAPITQILLIVASGT